MKNRILILSTWIFFTLSSCTSNEYMLVEKDKVKSTFIVNSSPTFKGYYYQGVVDSFHYFKSKWTYKTTRRFKLSTEDIVVYYGADMSDKWKGMKIDIVQNHTIDTNIFGHTEYCKLYWIEK